MNRLTGILLLTLTSLVVVMGTELKSGAGVPGRSDAIRAPTRPTDDASIEALRLSMPPLASLSQTTSRPLFAESRRPGEFAAGSVEVAPLDSGAGPTFSISAIVLTDKERAVLVNHPASGTPVRLREGESIAGWILKEVFADRATFAKEGESQLVTLRTFGPPRPAPKPPEAAGGGVAAPWPNDAELRRPRRPTRRESAHSILPSGQ